MRRTKEVTITEDGRDKGKTFVLTELPAEEGEVWAMRAMELLERAGHAVTEEHKAHGMQGLALTMRAPLTIANARALQDPSLDGMWKCVKFQPANRDAPPQKLFADEACQIEEWTTRLRLRMEFFRHVTGFFSHEKASTSMESSPAA